jgi:glycosyltransferase involved in cell wall biosynthesis
VKSRVDIILPIRTPAPYLYFTLQSIRDQSLTDFQLIAILDGPGPEAESLVKRLIPQSKIIHVPAHSGIGVALNAGLTESGADYIARIDADDTMSPTRLDLQRNFLDSHPDCVAVGSAVELIDGQGQVLGHRVAPNSAKRMRRRLRWRNALSHPASTFRRQAAIEAGGYSLTAQHLEDYVLWLNLAAMGEIVALPDALTRYRVHDTQLTNSINFSKSSLRELRLAREAFAKSEGGSITAARVRHQIWFAAQVAHGRISIGQ